VSLKNILLTTGKVAASIVLQTYLPGATGIIQQVEDLLGPKTGSEKKKLAAQMSLNVLSTLAKSGKLDGAAPALAEVETAVEQILAAMKATNQLVESKEGTLAVGGETFRIVVIGKIQ